MPKNKITPKGDLSWYIKWIASGIILIGMILTASNIQPYNMFFHAVGVTGWFIVGLIFYLFPGLFYLAYWAITKEEEKILMY